MLTFEESTERVQSTWKEILYSIFVNVSIWNYFTIKFLKNVLGTKLNQSKLFQDSECQTKVLFSCYISIQKLPH